MKHDRNPNGTFQKGSGGRPQGIRNRLHGDFIAAAKSSASEWGPGVIRIVRMEKPVEYLKVIAGTLPKEFHNLTGPIEDMTDDEITETLEKIRLLKTTGRPRKDGGGAAGGTDAAGDTPKVRH